MIQPLSPLPPDWFSPSSAPITLFSLQGWVREQFGEIVEHHTAIEGVARLLEQCGQLAEAIITRGSRDTRKELNDVLLVLLCLAEKEGIDLEQAARRDLVGRRASDYVAARE